MATYSVSDGNSDDGLDMESTDTGMVKLTIRSESEYFSVDKAREIRDLLALVIADAEGGSNG
ncbi:hypothetical protein [Kibdelosporangium phytohabitans]|uniref:Uncharacterized protein n=1 Tax=Kibdelosporangium phytohabitans TaxID=860235 RepID=A0A0N9HQ98_9PSEU|nr:hypothetical protein [Kibdelosporangium phytohabitans]ALG06869.1 hypothetical protein AOZ06_07920 [Kibdelosporangium phytohabitans]MBE1468119.1 hypothetical protein [Kibdelosporangium phytohabitans]